MITHGYTDNPKQNAFSGLLSAKTTKNAQYTIRITLSIFPLSSAHSRLATMYKWWLYSNTKRLNVPQHPTVLQCSILSSWLSGCRSAPTVGRDIRWIPAAITHKLYQWLNRQTASSHHLRPHLLLLLLNCLQQWQSIIGTAASMH